MFYVKQATPRVPCLVPDLTLRETDSPRFSRKGVTIMVKELEIPSKAWRWFAWKMESLCE